MVRKKGSDDAEASKAIGAFRARVGNFRGIEANVWSASNLPTTA
ncbi:hypothetical protein BH10CYA1_BH10CYA1_63800 [soil metagenome]